jgi:MFS family permease
MAPSQFPGIARSTATVVHARCGKSGWVFDGYETYALILTVAPVFRQLLPAGQLATIPFYAGLTIGVTLLGWGIGGIVGGILSDYVGRKRMLIYAMLAYSLTTGLTALAWSWTSFIALRFIVGLAIGSEWGTGAAMVAENVATAAPGQGRGADAVWSRHRLLPGVGGVAVCEPARAVGVEMDVCDRRASGRGNLVGAPRHRRA